MLKIRVRSASPPGWYRVINLNNKDAVDPVNLLATISVLTLSCKASMIIEAARLLTLPQRPSSKESSLSGAMESFSMGPALDHSSYDFVACSLTNFHQVEEPSDRSAIGAASISIQSAISIELVSARTGGSEGRAETPGLTVSGDLSSPFSLANCLIMACCSCAMPPASKAIWSGCVPGPSHCDAVV